MQLIDRLRTLDTCALSDSLDTLGLPGATVGLRPLWPSGNTVVGRARTIRVATKADAVAGVHIGTPVVADARPDDVVVIDNRGRTDVSCWGGILSVGAVAAGIAGIVVDGACRDINESQELGLPVFGRAVVPVSARNRVVQEAMDVPVCIAGVVVSSRDYVIADANGVVFIPAAQAEPVIELAERIAARERDMVAAVRSGRSLVDVMHDSQFPTTADATR